MMKAKTKQNGVTLVELLVVISILVILMAVAGRVMQLSVDDRRTREAARQINVFFGSARSQAMVTGRPCGVMFRRLEGQSLCVVGLDQVEVPPPYAGETLDSLARLQITQLSGRLATLNAQFTTIDPRGNIIPDAIKTSVLFISKGDLVQFNYQGPLYTIAVEPPGPTTSSLTLEIDLSQGQMLPWPRGTATWSKSIPYQITRRPGKSAVAGLQLPLRAVIDLEFSGFDSDIGKDPTQTLFGPALPDKDSAIQIMFLPNGSIGQVYAGTDPRPVTEPIFLLVGKQKRVPAGEAEDGLANWQDMKNFWVTLSPQTGRITTTEVAKGTNLFESREIAREGQSMGGR